MNSKCDKYEAIFTFADDETLMRHIDECPDCTAEHEKMQRVSDLLKEVKPVFRKQKKTNVLKAACVVLAVFVVGGISFNELNRNYDVIGHIRYGDMSIEDYGFPVDSYGLLMVD
ncbi:MAG: hypothetical protein LBJ74_02280 [Heliobacteriaceae bacterium]|jgi:hypothetical protein|nr:hypothetical protein [Heliobacteriaceae bacterium]